MSALTSKLLRNAAVVAASLILAGCVTSAEQTASQADEDWLG